jgi:signal transduction histidine kinase
LRRLLSDPASLRRSRDERMVAGVAGGLAARAGVDPTVARIGLVLLTVFGGVGAVLYVLAWLIVPVEGDDEPLGRRAIADLPGLGLAIGVLGAVIATAVVIQTVGLKGPSRLLWPAGVSASGMVLVWRNAEGDDREALRRIAAQLALIESGGPGRTKAMVARVVAGAILVLGGVAGLFGTIRHTRATGWVVVATLGVMAGVVIVFGPWWLRLGRDLAEEKRERVRSEERADLAAHLHDSVLQTLALIQRSSTNPREVTRLARAQERELRAWLFEERVPSGRLPGEATTVAAGVDLVERDVELRYGVAVEAVVVGDAALDDDLRALLAATREATVNAAKWSGAEVVSVFAEVEAQRASVFIRDRGRGFDLEGIGGDRRGVTESILGRIERRGGKAVIRSVVGAGTEVELIIPRRPAP